MIDIENQVFDRVATRVREQFPDIFMTGEYVNSPPSFPAVSLVEADNGTRIETMDTSFHGRTYESGVLFDSADRRYKK